MKINLLCAIGALTLATFCFGQNPVPNASFENWTGIDPDDWHTSNSPGGNSSNVTPASPGHTGQQALKGEVLVWPGTPGFPFIPLLESITSDFGFPVDKAYNNVSMYLQFQPLDFDDALTIYVGVLDEEGTSIGGGFAELMGEVDTFTRLDIPLTYAPGQPYRAFVSMTVNNYGSTGLPAIGTSFIVDDIVMEDAIVNGAEDKAPVATLQTVFPNPATADLAVAFSLENKRGVSIGIFDLLGRRVSHVFAGELHQGNHTLLADVSDLPNGIYFCRLSTSDGVMAQKIQVARS